MSVMNDSHCEGSAQLCCFTYRIWIERLRALVRQMGEALEIFNGIGWHYTDDELAKIEAATAAYKEMK